MVRGRHNTISELLEEIEAAWPSQAGKLSDEALDDLVDRWNRTGKILRHHQQQRRREQEEELNYCNGSEASTIPSEVLRQVLPFLTAHEAGRFFVISCKSMLRRVGSETVWRDICKKMWPPLQQTGETHPLDYSLDQRVVEALGSYEIYFRQRQKTILLAQEDLAPLAAPMTGIISSSDHNKASLVLNIWKGSSQQCLISETVMDLQELWEQASITKEISSPVEVAKLPRQKAHGWDIPPFFENVDDGRARLQLFPLVGNGKEETPSLSSKAATNAPVLLDTSFCWWRGWSLHGEVTFIQRERTVGLQLTDRGQWIQHRVSQCRHPRWMSYLGLQFKVVVLCERLASSDPHDNAEFVTYGFTKVRVEAIRLHENSNGNIQHHLFRQDQGWQKHGVTLSHLLEELC